MGALLTLPISLLNLLLPFTKPGTPLLQDLAHTAALCTTLYYAPQIAEWYNTRQHHHIQIPAGESTNEDTHQPAEPDGPRHNNDPPLDERLVHQPSDTEDEPEPRPLAPTPPNLHNAREPPLPQAVNIDNDNDFPRPAPNEAGPANTRANRVVGAKKAKSLARKDQRRAYHEFHRQEAELRRLQEQEGAEEREVEASAERERRARIEASIAEKEREERRIRKEDAQRELDQENERRERVLDAVRREVRQRGCVDLLAEARKEGKDRIWVLKLVRASALLGQMGGQGSKVMVTGDGWLVRIDEEIMAQAYRDAEAFGANNGGRVGYEDLGGFVERAVRARAMA